MRRGTVPIALALLSAVACRDNIEPTAPMRSYDRFAKRPALTGALLSLTGVAPGAERQITTDPGGQVQPAISGGRIVWQDDRNGNVDIYLFDLSTNTERQITTDPAMQYLPAVSGDRIVWTDDRTGQGDIFLYDLATSTERQISTDATNKGWAAISADRIVWAQFRTNEDIYLFDLATNTERQITTDPGDQWAPAISGDRIVWQDDRNGNVDIYLYDLSTNTERQITADPAVQAEEVISGDRIVWRDNRNGNWDIYLYDLSTNTERQITTDPADQLAPAISGDRIVWSDHRNGNWDIYMYDLVTNTEQQITTDPADQGATVISGDRIVWSDQRNGNLDIYLLDLSADAETPHAPIALFTATPSTVAEGAVVSFDASGSSDPDGDVLTYNWSYGDGSSDLTSAADMVHYYADDGTYQVTLTVSDPTAATGTMTRSVTVTNVAPVLGELAGPTTPLAIGASASITGTFTDPGIVDTHTGTVDWSDGTTSLARITEAGGSGSLEAAHIYTSAGTYEVTVTLSDNGGGTATGRFQPVVVYNTPAGSNIPVTPVDAITGQPGPIQLSFGNVSSPGQTTLTITQVGQGGPPPPANFRLGSPPLYYSINTTASFTGPVTVCIDYTAVSYGHESALQLRHFEGGQWVQVPTDPGYPDLEGHVICGTVTTLSEFVVGAPTYSTTAGHRFLQPLNMPPQAISVFKIDKTIPVKFQLFLADGVTPVTTAVATIQVTRVSSDISSTVNEGEVTALSSQGINFRYDAVGQQYIFNLSTKGWTPGIYRITALLDDESSIWVDVGAR